MAEPRDPIERAADDSTDLYDVATWEVRTAVDRLATRLYATLAGITRAVVFLLAAIILLAQLVLGGFTGITNPVIGAFIVLSIIPALAIAVYVWRTDVTTREPVGLLVGTFLLGILFAGFAAVLNSIAQLYFLGIPVLGLVLFFYLVVGPVEETVKWLAIRLYAYRSTRFNAVIDGAVYGAMAGLGFATIENTVYIGQQYLTALSQAGQPDAVIQTIATTAGRTFAGPGHVLYSAFAGYYLGLAKFNREHAGPIVVKGLLIAAVLHATYNSLVTYLPPFLQLQYGVPPGVAFLGFILVYDGAVAYWLYRKIKRYRRTYRAVGAGERATHAEGDGAHEADVAADSATRESAAVDVDEAAESDQQG